MLVAVSFSGGYVLAAAPVGAGSRLHKVTWGLVAGGSRPLTSSERADLVHFDPLEPQPVAAHLTSISAVSWVFTLEPGQAELRAHALDPAKAGGQPRELTWGAVLGESPEDPETVRGASLVVEGGLDRDREADYRVSLVVQAFAWAAARMPELGPDVEVGIHEPGGRFSVDRVSWQSQARE